MAKKETSGVPAVVEKNQNLATTMAGGMELLQELPDDYQGSTEGTEEITLDEIKMPRVSIAQGLSLQVNPDRPEFIDGLRLGDMFNDLTGEVYGRGPLYFIPLKRTVIRIEFRPRAEGGGVVDMDVPVGDPRLEWSRDESGKSQPPKATTFHEFISLLCKNDATSEVAAISIKTTNKFDREAAKRLNSFIKARVRGKDIPIYGKVYKLESKQETNAKGTFGVHVVSQAGFTPEPLAKAAKAYLDSLAGKVIRVNREPGDDTSFDTDSM